MTPDVWISTLVELAAGTAAAPLLPGIIQAVKARLQGRPGPSPLQPYRELNRLWHKSTVDPEGSGFVYRLAPPLATVALLAAVVIVPATSFEEVSPLGHDVLVVVGLLALARFSLAVAAWDTGSGFALMGASRDLTFAVLVEGMLLAVVALVALPSHSTDLGTLMATTSGLAGWGGALRWCALGAFGLVVLAETGRQPIDNPDTHLELTMIHEGPLLEYAGRDLAMLQWSAAARHWIMLVLTVEIFLPHAHGALQQLLSLLIGLPLWCVLLAVIETWQAKMRLLAVPRLLGAGTAIALAGFVTWFIGARP
ncbi:MAG: respiratory chain complex I subunit 1 family protein [Acidimicrobiales bacterium]